MGIGELIRSRPILIACLVLALSAAFLSRIPLFNSLGYEFSAVLGLVAGTTLGISTIALIRRGKEPRASPRQFVLMLGHSGAVNLLTLALPLALISVNALFVKNCSFVEGLSFFFLIPVVSAIYATALGTFCAVMFRQSYLWFVLITLVTLLHPIYLGYFSPQLFSYNVLYGYFPGLSYDETLALSWSLVVFRLATLVLAGICLVVSMTVMQHAQPDASFGNRFLSLKHLFGEGMRSGILLVSFVFLSIFSVEREDLRIETSHEFIQKTLGSVRQTRHFRIYYDRSSMDETRIMWIAAEHEFRLQQVARALNVRVSGKIDSYIYPTAELKRDLIGSGTTNITKPWLKEMHLNAESVEQVLKHELVHVLSGNFGIPFARLSVSTGLMEGLAMAVEWDWGNRTLHEYAAGMFKHGIVSSPSSVEPILTFRGFVQRPSTTSYVLSGSFVRYLIDRYGIEKFKRAYAWGILADVYGRPQKELLKEWMQFLDRIEVSGDSEAGIRYLFLRPSVFQKVCARVLANINREAWSSFHRKDYDKAIELFERSSALSNNPDAIIGLVQSHSRRGDWRRVEEIASSALDDTLLASSSAALRLYLGDAYWASRHYEKAEREYQELLRMSLSDSFDEAVQLRLLAVADRESRDDIQQLLLMDSSDSVRVDALERLRKSHPRSRLIPFLLGQVLHRVGEFDRSQEVLTRTSQSLFHPFLQHLSEYTQGLNLHYLGEFQRAKMHFWNSLNFGPSLYRENVVNEWIDRCDWMTEFAPSSLDSQ